MPRVCPCSPIDPNAFRSQLSYRCSVGAVCHCRSGGRLSSSTEPLVPMCRHKFVIIQMWISSINTVDLLLLTGAEPLIQIKAPGSTQQSLPTKHLVDARNAACVPIRRVKD